MLGPINAYQAVQQNTQNAQVRNPNGQQFLAQERNQPRAERLNETRQASEPVADSNSSRQLNNNFEERAENLIARGDTQRGSLLDILA